ncbi:hypothetical protein [Dyadobacter sp. LHD-138]|uniref:hypothetical protein n=1 Tax=Dyadobacter sp. LHD-138 TaxID=3071413 RepID=UPI0027E1C4AC|nr:hypothetical protein [Dyadobacter sp. LHD-138]MDQ6480536.1 hypothetical protein [Dyadobacter sp. LHD-138]
MKPFEEEINDAIRRKLQSSLTDFERKPDADMDHKMYQMLKKAPYWKQPYMLWGLVGLLLFVGAGVFIYKEQLQSDQPVGVAANARQSVAMIDRKTLPEIPNLGQPIVEAYQGIPNGKTLDNNSVTEKQKADRAGANVRPNITLLSDTDKQQEAGRSSAHIKEVNYPIDQQTIKPGKNLYAGQKLTPEAQTDSKENEGDITGKGVRKRSTSSIELLSLRSTLANGSKMNLPEIGYPKSEDLASFARVKPDSLHRKLYIDLSALKKMTFVFTVTPFQTLQQVSVLSREGYRIQNVELAGTLSTLGYKFGAGLQKGGFQLLVNFSRINTHLNYAYASAEFKVVEKPLNDFEIKRLGVVKSESKSSNLLGLGAKKQIDFTSRQLGWLYTTVGVEYSRFLGQNSGGLLFLNFSSGKSFLIHSSTNMSVGPYFEYSFGRIKAADQQITIGPSQVGLSIQLKLGQDK